MALHRDSGIEHRKYDPSGSYPFGVEIASMFDLKQRTGKTHLSRVHRIEFHMLILVTRGECVHVIDFEAVRCRVGSLMLLKPSQAEMFDLVSDWDGWIILFGPEFLFPAQSRLTSDTTLLNRLEDLTECMQLTESECSHLESAIEQMRDCCAVEASVSDTNAILRYYLSALLLRICLMQEGVTKTDLVKPDVMRFRRFKEAVGTNFYRWHQVCDYARALECSEKTLTRATLSITGVSAKRFIVDRISLEAKRLLAYTSLPTSEISSRLGFDEATNFIKFFRREIGSTPGAFRSKHR
ncbi:AraC family transcriptional regulator [Pararhizobium sp. A13]|uniref:AraC family transcriptional regulator n=1 Tax=Pararhizobium sp. A13 TaxID=3133975 RepID=UPI00311B1AD9